MIHDTRPDYPPEYDLEEPPETAMETLEYLLRNLEPVGLDPQTDEVLYGIAKETLEEMVEAVKSELQRQPSKT